MIFVTIYTIMAILTASIIAAIDKEYDPCIILTFLILSFFIWWIILPLLILTKVTLLLAEKIEKRFNK